MKKETLSNKFTIYYIIAYLFVLSFISGNEATTNQGVVIPFILVKPVFPILIILVVGTMLVVLRGRVKLDALAFWFFGRMVICLIPAFFDEVHSSYWGNYITACFPFFIYVFFLNTRVDIKKVSSIFILFGILVAVECFFAYYLIVDKGLAFYDAPYYKDFFVIPVGATNNISAVLLPLMIFGSQIIKKKAYKVVYVGGLLVAVYFCKSRTGMILCVAYLIFSLFKRYQGEIANTKKKMIFLFPFFTIMILYFIIYTGLWEDIYTFMLGFSKSGGGLNSLMSGRLQLFGSVFENISDCWLFGNGVSYEKMNFKRTHNVFLQMLFENGVIGLAMFLLFLGIVINRIKCTKNVNDYYFAFYMATPFILINSLVEETFFSNFMILFCLFFLAKMKLEIDYGGKKDV